MVEWLTLNDRVSIMSLPLIKEGLKRYLRSPVSVYETTRAGEGGEMTSRILGVEERLNKVVPLYDRFDDVQSQIETLVAGSNIEQAQLKERDSFETLYFDTVASVKTYISNTTSRIGLVPSTSSTASNAQSPTVHKFGSGVKLSIITLPNFDGSYDNWIKFRVTFESLIHNNACLTDIQKFHYLDAALKGDAARVIKSLGVSSANYVIA
ncbi:hypothetical protein KPH14_000827 [Odynerus spinipes]|uniref:Uncharacterized protein n=1 Tax=Odynerus spinipes TaxID=1348599 RepID=A0AAD9R8Z8_9HYME|nr:hypothetical protein KPH14_000827 [Odynerus spinipes]